MITAALEKLVLSGKASFNTYVIGGAQKYILNVQSDRFIIITGITYFNRLQSDSIFTTGSGLEEILNNSITQLRVFSAKSNNLFTFRDSLSATQDSGNGHIITPVGSTHIDTYLIHDSSVSFTFSNGGARSSVAQIANPKEPAQQPPFDYGKEGQPNAIPVNYVSVDATVGNIVSVPAGDFDLGNLDLEGKTTTNEFTYPVDILTAPFTDQAYAMPLIHVSYVEILGNPTNIAATL